MERRHRLGLLTERIKGQRLAMALAFVSGDVLELGCGPALLLARAGGQITSYTGVERFRGDVERLRAQYPQAEFLAADLDEDRPAFPRAYDTVLMLALIEHLYNQKRVLELATSALKPGGRLVITTPTPFGNDVVHQWGARLGLFSREAADDHIVIYNRRRFELVARDFGLELAHYRRFQCGCNQLAVLRRPA
jgi:SAM-dependent methyltransferase